MQLGLIDEIILDIEPIVLGSGVRLFGTHNDKYDLELLETRTIGTGTIQVRYKVC